MSMSRWDICLHNLSRLHAQAEKRKKATEDQAKWRARERAKESARWLPGRMMYKLPEEMVDDDTQT